MNTRTAILIASIVIGGTLVILGMRDGRASISQENVQNVRVVNGTQIIEIKAKGGYHPRISSAKAGIPTILRFDTSGTFDCSASVRIPSMNISELLPNSGTKDITLGTPSTGTLQGSCGMGMYPFQINFQ